MFDKALFYNSLKTLSFGKNIYIYDTVTSTNNVLLNGDFSYGSVITASSQTKGKGRNGRIWIDTGSSLLFSILLTGLSTEMLMPFNIIAGYAVCSGISLYAETKLKWPNDCVISGMLLEASFTGNKAAKIVFGAGINVFNKEFPEDIAYRATSVCLNTDKEIKKELILAETLNTMEQMLNQYKEGILKIEDLWQEYSANYNKKIYVHINTNQISNINIGEIGYDFNS